MSKNAIYGMWGRYNATPPTLLDGDSGALQLDSSGAVKLTTSLPAGLGTPKPGTKFGQPGRYNANAMTLSDGDEVALQLDENGNLIIN